MCLLVGWRRAGRGLAGLVGQGGVSEASAWRRHTSIVHLMDANMCQDKRAAMGHDALRNRAYSCPLALSHLRCAALLLVLSVYTHLL